MSEKIYISPDTLFTKLIKTVPDDLQEAMSLLQKVDGSVQSSVYVPCGEYWSVFNGSTQPDIHLQLNRLSRLVSSCDNICRIIVEAPTLYSETDRSFKGTLGYSWGERVKIRLNEYRANAIPNRSFSEVIHSLFARNSGAVDGYTVINTDCSSFPVGTVAAIDTATAATATSIKHKVKLNPGDDDQFSKAAKSIWSTEVDNARDGNTHKYSYGSETHGKFSEGTFTLLGSDFGYDKYYDYNSASFEQENGDAFYSYDAGLKREGTHIDFYELVPNGIDGSLVMNGISTYADGNFDLAKGNAYVRGGADYSMYSLNLLAQSDTPISLGLSGEIGVGAHLNIGIHNGKFTADVGAALGIGASVNFEVDYEECWADLKDMFCLN